MGKLIIMFHRTGKVNEFLEYIVKEPALRCKEI